MVKLTFPDGNTKSFKDGITGFEVAQSIGERLAQAALAVKINGTMIDLDRPIKEDGPIEIVTFDSDEGKQLFWHSSAHLLAMAVKELFPKAQMTIGPPIEQGFYYDFAVEEPFTPEDLEKIEAKMKEWADKDVPFVREEVNADEAKKRFADNKYKLELIDEYEDQKLSIYKNDGFKDLYKVFLT
jgi:threonyl-tRNA synthetase